MLEPWLSKDAAGDVLSREQLLGEIKTNMIAVINDYKELGIENENQLILMTSKLFMGDIIPTKTDWENLNTVLRELATVKEQGVMYDYFIQDISDSLGVSDLEKIKDFIDYIQSLSPRSATVTVQLNPPAKYDATKPVDSTTDNWDHATIKWGLTSNYLEKPTAVIKLTPSVSEDVKSYDIKMESGNYTNTITKTPKDLGDITVPLNWLEWFGEKELDDVWFKVSVDVTDKRGNVTSSVQSVKYPASVKIPQGVKNYQLEYKRDNTNWTRISNTAEQSYYFNVPRINGTYTYRVRVLDKNGTTTNWVESNPRYIRFIPDKPDKPVVKASTTWKDATVTWNAVPRAEYYEVWHGNEKWCKDNTKNGQVHWKRLKATEKREVLLHKLNENARYDFYVRAINEGGENIGSASARTKKRQLKTVTYNKTGYRIWRGDYVRINKNKSRKSHKANWRKSSNIYQGGWGDEDWGRGRWYLRAGGSYWAYGGQRWGNHMSFLFFDYNKMRRDLSGKSIQKVSISLTRASGTPALNAHGYKQATPLYLYNHNRENNTSTSELRMFRDDRKEVNKNTQKAVGSAIFNRGETETFTNNTTKKLIQNIVDGHMKGIGIVKYYGSSFNSTIPLADKAYMILKPNVSIKVQYYED